MKEITRYTVKLVKEECKRYEVENPVRSVTSAVNLLNRVFDFEDLPTEMFVMVALDVKKKVIGTFVISQGTIDMTPVSPRDVFQKALLVNAHTIIVAHNHPSGDPTPSKQDIAFTKDLMQAGKIMGIQICDSIILGHDIYYSFLEEEWFKNEKWANKKGFHYPQKTESLK